MKKLLLPIAFLICSFSIFAQDLINPRLKNSFSGSGKLLVVSSFDEIRRSEFSTSDITDLKNSLKKLEQSLKNQEKEITDLKRLVSTHKKTLDEQKRKIDAMERKLR